MSQSKRGDVFESAVSPTSYDRSLPVRRLPADNTDVWIGRWSSIPYLRVAWHTRARLTVLRHCYEKPSTETGGVLLGGVYRTQETGGPADWPTDFIEIAGSIRADYTEAGQGHLQFTPESWAKINRIRDIRYPESTIVGWYHSHPGHGLYLSGHDLFIHNNFFAEDFQLALVVETHQNRGAFFVDSVKRDGPYKSHEFCWDRELVLERSISSSYLQRPGAEDRSSSLIHGPVHEVRSTRRDASRSAQSSEHSQEQASGVSPGQEPEVRISETDLPQESPESSRSTGQYGKNPARPLPGGLSLGEGILVGIVGVALLIVFIASAALSLPLAPWPMVISGILLAAFLIIVAVTIDLGTPGKHEDEHNR
jgi:proteasome lid subunit RPN8/RPN11